MVSTETQVSNFCKKSSWMKSNELSVSSHLQMQYLVLNHPSILDETARCMQTRFINNWQEYFVGTVNGIFGRMRRIEGEKTVSIVYFADNPAYLGYIRGKRNSGAKITDTLAAQLNLVTTYRQN